MITRNGAVQDLLGGSAIDFLAVADLNNVDEQCRIVYCVYDPVATLADAVSVLLSSELLATARAWLVRERRDLSCNPLPFPLRYNGLKFLDGGRPDLDVISRHVVSIASARPRTCGGAPEIAP